MSDAAIELTLRFAPLARRPDIRRFGRRWDVCVEVDGHLHVFQEGPRHVIPTGAGSHVVRVWFRGAGIAILSRWVRFGKKEIAVEVAPESTVRLLYQGSTFWHAGGGASLTLV
jgi:hypothetical protein